MSVSLTRRNLVKNAINLKNLSIGFMQAIEGIAEHLHLCNHSMPLFRCLFKSRNISAKVGIFDIAF
jgi:hypothetical protein